MVWDHLSPTQAHVAYAGVACFSIFFSLFSLFIKEKMYLGEAPLATLYGLITGPHCLKWINPFEWGNWQTITLEISRVLLCVEIVAVSVELPKKYILKHWFSVFLLLIPCMTAGFLIIGLFTWAILPGINFSEGLLIAACITATDPVLAQAVVGKGKFAQRVPAHLRNLLNAESACNDGISVPFTYLALNLIIHAGKSREIAFDFIVVTVLYECVFGAIMGATIGFLGRKLLRFSEKKHIIDSESFLAFYVLLAVLCAGFGSILGCDDLLASFCAGTAFAWDGWFTKKTEESHVSTVIDLLLNLSYFVYFGTIIPWEQFNSHVLGLDSWRLVCLALCVLAFRRIPAVLAIKRICPDINNWKEALFVGHFGPIGVGAVYTAIVAIASLENEVLHIRSGPTTDYPDDLEYHRLIRIIWPCVTFLILTSIIVHGTSVAVIVLGRHLQSMSFTLTFTRTETTGGGWISRPLGKDKNGNTLFSHITKKEEQELEEELDEGETSDFSSMDMTAIPAGLRRKMRRRRRRMRRARRKKSSVRDSSKGRPEGAQLDLSGPRRPASTATSAAASATGSNAEPEIQSRTSSESSRSSSSSISSGYSSTEELGVEHAEKAIEGETTNTVNGSSSGEPSGEPSPRAERLEDQEHSLIDEQLGRSEQPTSENESDADLDSTEPVSLSHVVTEVRAPQALLDKLKQQYQLSEKDLEPIYRDGELLVPRRGYKDGNTLVIEDQNGDIMRKINAAHPDVSDQESIKSVFSTKTMQSLKRKFSRKSNKSADFPLPLHLQPEQPSSTLSSFSFEKNPDSDADSAIVYVPVKKQTNGTGSSSTREDTETETLESAGTAPPADRKVKTVLPQLPKLKAKIEEGSSKVAGRREQLQKKIEAMKTKNRPRRLHISEKLHGFRIGDTIIIEDKEGTVVGTYKINPQKGQFYKTKPDALLSKALQAVGLAKGPNKPEADKEKNLESSSTVYPAEGTLEDRRIERKLRAFIKNPGKLRMNERDARAASKKYVKDHPDTDVSESETDSGSGSESESSSSSGSDSSSGSESGGDNESIGSHSPEERLAQETAAVSGQSQSVRRRSRESTTDRRKKSRGEKQ